MTEDTAEDVELPRGPHRVPTRVGAVTTLGDEAQRVASSLPPGRAYIVNDTSELPLVFRRIFEQARLFDDEL